MSKLYKAYAAVHSKDIKEELYSKKDQISEMNLDQLTDSDLVEITEEIIQGMFDYGCTTQNAIDFVTETLKSVTYENSPERRSVKIERITEAFNITFERITDKAKTTSIEEFNNYRKSKPLIEKWNNRVNHEIGNQKVHGSLIAKDREFIKSSLSSLIHEKMDKSYLEPDMAKRRENNKKALADMKETKAHKDMVVVVRKAMGVDEENVAELYKGKHGQTEKEYQDSRSDAGKMISGDSKGSGASYSYKAKNTGPNPAGGSKKPEGQARMSSKDRQYLKYRKSMMKKEEIEFVNKLVESGKFSSVEIAKIADIQEADIADIIARLEKK